jgi:DNA primase
MESLNEKEDFSIASFLNELDQELVNNISSILMEEEKYTLHNWESKDIYPKEKGTSVAQLVSETILTLRCYLIKKRIDTLQQNTEDQNDDNREVLEEIVNYLQLNKLLSSKLNRVLS